MDEEKLIEAAKSGDKIAMAGLVKAYEKTVYNFAFKICRNPDLAEDIMQDTFFSMIKSLKQFDGKSKLSTWLYRIAFNHYLMGARKNPHKFISLDDEKDLYDNRFISDWNTIPVNYLENKELRNILDNSIEKLSPEYRAVFLLRDVEGLSTEETAKITEISIPAVKSRLHRARAFLRKEINKAFQK
ncbi:MAG: sigma-70 family RNA polymerase sigma factor [Ignavibacteriaceae bacterium]|jgi:RNA polymerase sigma-70 factor (ECF subfamily)